MAALVGVVGCTRKESRYDVFLRGLQVEGDAERGPCRLVYEDPTGPAILTGDQVLSCLRRTEEAIVLYEQSIEMGHKGIDVDRTYERAKERRARLEQMLTQVRKMERGE